MNQLDDAVLHYDAAVQPLRTMPMRRARPIIDVNVGPLLKALAGTILLQLDPKSASKLRSSVALATWTARQSRAHVSGRTRRLAKCSKDAVSLIRSRPLKPAPHFDAAMKINRPSSWHRSRAIRTRSALPCTSRPSPIGRTIKAWLNKPVIKQNMVDLGVGKANIQELSRERESLVAKATGLLSPGVTSYRRERSQARAKFFFR